MGIQLTNGQNDAVNKVHHWWQSQYKQVFEIAGYAGSGKSTVVNILIERIGLHLDEVAFVTFTGKASLVLTMKGTPATTIHKRIYRIEQELIHKTDPRGMLMYDLEGKPKYTVKHRFVKLDKIDPNIKLIVADECSMISEKMWEDLKSFNIPIIVLGDPGLVIGLDR